MHFCLSGIRWYKGCAYNFCRSIRSQMIPIAGISKTDVRTINFPAMTPFLEKYGQYDSSLQSYVLSTGTDALITSILSGASKPYHSACRSPFAFFTPGPRSLTRADSFNFRSRYIRWSLTRVISRRQAWAQERHYRVPLCFRYRRCLANWGIVTGNVRCW